MENEMPKMPRADVVAGEPNGLTCKGTCRAGNTVKKRPPTTYWSVFSVILMLSVLLGPAVGHAAVPPVGKTEKSEKLSPTNQIKNGGFEMAVNAAARIPFWKAGETCTISRFADGTAYLSLQNTSHESSSVCNQTIMIKPEWKQLKVSVRARVKALVPGTKERWHDCKVALAFDDAKKKRSYAHPFIWRKPAPQWQQYTKTIDIPKGAVKAYFSLAIFNAIGSADFDNLVVEAVSGAGVATPLIKQAQAIVYPVLGTTPSAAELQWGQEPIETESAARATICLNGQWRFAPFFRVEKAENWGVIRVPGSWKGWGYMPGLTRKGKNWNNKISLPNLERAWYEREIRIPRDWAGRKVILDFKRISTDATVFLDGKRVGELRWPGGTLDLTPFCGAGQTQHLAVLVEANVMDKEVIRYMGPEAEQITKQKVKLHLKGIIGDVLLHAGPASGQVENLVVRTSTRNKEISLVFTVLPQAGKSVSVKADVLTASGSLEKTFASAVEVDALGRASVAWKWDDPTLWDIDAPHLYRLNLQVSGDAFSDSLSRSFGFREFWIEGKDFYLNGVCLRLRPQNAAGCFANTEAIRTQVAGLKKCGFNIIELTWADISQRGWYDDDYLWIQEADKQGMLVIARVVDAGEVVSQKLVNERMIEYWKGLAQERVAGLINHPSLVMWVFAGNRFGFGQDQNPDIVGCKQEFETNFNPWLQAKRSGFNALKALKEIDPTRPAFTHAGSFVGDVYNVNNYLCLLPLQEREEWLSHWAEHGDMPFMACEFGLPLEATFQRGRKGIGFSQRSEPLMSEFSATYLGAEAYRLEHDVYRQYIQDSFRGGQKYETSVFYEWHGPAMKMVQELYIRNTYRSWRTAGVTGGMVPWGPRSLGSKAFNKWLHKERRWDPEMVRAEHPWQPGQRGTYQDKVLRNQVYIYTPGGKPTDILAQTLVENNSETLAWIAGGTETFTDKVHVFSPGERVRKQVALLNDTRHRQAYTWQAKVLCGGKLIDTLSQSGIIEPGETLLEKLSFSVDRHLASDHVSGEVVLQANIASNSHSDTFRFEVLNKIERKRNDSLLVLDPVGDTRDMLRTLGWQTREWQGEPGLVVVGRGALQHDNTILPRLKTHINAGGRAILMAQDPQWLRENAGWRVALHMARRVFPVASSGGWKNVDPEWLRDWRGESTLLPPKTPEISGINDLIKAPGYGWRWGGRGAVSSCAVEKPHYGGWTPLLECEFDLAYSPLMQLAYGKGLLVFCGLDVEDHAAIEPAAAHILAKLVDYTRDADPAPRKQTVFIGNSQDEARLRASGLLYETVTTLPTGDALAILSADASVEAAALQAFARRGGRALVLASRKTGRGQWGVSLRKEDRFHGSLQVPDWPVCQGLSASDLRWRADGTAYLLADGCEIGADGLLGRQIVGKGEIIYCQLDPALLQADEKTYLRYTRWRQARGLSQLMANLGATFKADGHLFNVKVSSGVNRIELAGQWKARLTNGLAPLKNNKQHPDPGISDTARPLLAVSCSEEGFETVPVPSVAEFYGVKWETDGEMVFRKVVEIPAEWSGQELTLGLGPVDDFDATYFNGVKVGQMDIKSPKFWSTPRVYTIPAELVKPGKAVLAIRVFDHMGGGGLVGQKEQLYLKLAGEEEKDLPNPYYHLDYREDFPLGDDPYRYYRW
jgi:beta-galactosidase